VEVEASPLMNAVDTTNGYVMDKAQIESVPLATGSFTGLATQSTASAPSWAGGTGANSGLGNAPIWANGQRDTSNSLPAERRRRQQPVQRQEHQPGGLGARHQLDRRQTSPGGGGGVIQSAASIYLSIGNAIPTPAPETIAEVRVNASMYDAQQGSTSGAHIDLSTASGTNACTAGLRAPRHQLDQCRSVLLQPGPDVPAYDKVPELHRYIAGGTLGGPIIKDKLFGFSAISTCTSPTRRSATRSSTFRLA
jgi:hypothetical protein